jgi:hypothetical protein
LGQLATLAHGIYLRVGSQAACFCVLFDFLRNPVFLDRHSGFDWTLIPVLSGQWFSVFFLP